MARAALMDVTDAAEPSQARTAPSPAFANQGAGGPGTLTQQFLRALKASKRLAARLLNAFAIADMDVRLSWLPRATIAELHRTACDAPSVGPESNVAKETRHRDLVHTYDTAVECKPAAEFFNASAAATMEYHLERLEPDQVASLHRGALDSVGPGSRVAEMTAPAR